MIKFLFFLLFFIFSYANNIKIFGYNSDITNNKVIIYDGMMIKDGMLISAKQIIYNKLKKAIIAKGNVYINYDKFDFILSNEVNINLNTKQIVAKPFFLFNLYDNSWILSKKAIKKNDFYISAGLIGSLRINSHSKRYYDELNKEFDVLQYDKQTQDFVKIGTATSPDYPKVKKFDDFYLNPFRLDATARIGWGRVNLFATYALTPMFRKNKGPELYPWSIGIVLTN